MIGIARRLWRFIRVPVKFKSHPRSWSQIFRSNVKQLAVERGSRAHLKWNKCDLHWTHAKVFELFSTLTYFDLGALKVMITVMSKHLTDSTQLFQANRSFSLFAVSNSDRIDSLWNSIDWKLPPPPLVACMTHIKLKLHLNNWVLFLALFVAFRESKSRWMTLETF